MVRHPEHAHAAMEPPAEDASFVGESEGDVLSEWEEREIQAMGDASGALAALGGEVKGSNWRFPLYCRLLREG